MIVRAWIRTTTMCAWCGGMLMARIEDLRQRCPNDCASGLGAAPDSRLPGAPRGRASDRRRSVMCDGVAGELDVAIRP